MLPLLQLSSSPPSMKFATRATQLMVMPRIRPENNLVMTHRWRCLNAQLLKSL
jgi:hypothetical protein